MTNSPKKLQKMDFTWDIETRRGQISSVPWYFGFQLTRPLTFQITLHKISEDKSVWKASADDLNITGVGPTPKKAIKSLAAQLLVLAESNIQYTGEVSKWIAPVGYQTSRAFKKS